MIIWYSLTESIPDSLWLRLTLKHLMVEAGFAFNIDDIEAQDILWLFGA